MVPRLLLTDLRKSIQSVPLREHLSTTGKKMGSKSSQTPFIKKGRPNSVFDNLLNNVKDVMIGIEQLVQGFHAV